MNTSKIYHDSDGNECSIFQIVRREPDWAASRIQEGEKAIERINKIDQQTEAEKISAVMLLADESLNPDDHTELQRILSVLCVTRGIMVVPE